MRVGDCLRTVQQWMTEAANNKESCGCSRVVTAVLPIVLRTLPKTK